MKKTPYVIALTLVLTLALLITFAPNAIAEEPEVIWYLPESNSDAVFSGYMNITADILVPTGWSLTYLYFQIYSFDEKDNVTTNDPIEGGGKNVTVTGKTIYPFLLAFDTTSVENGWYTVELELRLKYNGSIENLVTSVQFEVYNELEPSIEVKWISPTEGDVLRETMDIHAAIYVPEGSYLEHYFITVYDEYGGEIFFDEDKPLRAGETKVEVLRSIDMLGSMNGQYQISISWFDGNGSSGTDELAVTVMNGFSDYNGIRMEFIQPEQAEFLYEKVPITVRMECNSSYIADKMFIAVRGEERIDIPLEPRDMKCPGEYTWETIWDTTEVEDGFYLLNFTAMPGDPWYATSIGVFVANREVPPPPLPGELDITVNINDPEDGEVFGSATNILFDATINVKAKDESLKVRTVATVYVDGETVFSEYFEGPGVFTLKNELGPLEDGMHFIDVQVESETEDAFATGLGGFLIIFVGEDGKVPPFQEEPSLVDESVLEKDGTVKVDDRTVDFGAPEEGALPGNYGYEPEYEWDFGDGTTSNESDPSHVYSKDGTYTVTLRINYHGGGSEEYTNIVHVKQDIGGTTSNAGPVVSVGGPSEVFILGTVLVVMMVAVFFLGGTEVGLYAVFPFFVWLYTKIKSEKVLDHYVRGKIHGYIIANPGDHYNMIKDSLGLRNGSLAYHLRVLEREGYIKSMREGVYKRFYPAHASLPSDRLTPMERLIMREVRDREGVTQKEVARLIEESPQVVNYHVRNLEMKGMIKIERYGRETLLYDSADHISRNPGERARI